MFPHDERVNNRVFSEAGSRPICHINRKFCACSRTRASTAPRGGKKKPIWLNMLFKPLISPAEEMGEVTEHELAHLEFLQNTTADEQTGSGFRPHGRSGCWVCAPQIQPLQQQERVASCLEGCGCRRRPQTHLGAPGCHQLPDGRGCQDSRVGPGRRWPGLSARGWHS